MWVRGITPNVSLGMNAPIVGEPITFSHVTKGCTSKKGGWFKRHGGPDGVQLPVWLAVHKGAPSDGLGA